MMNEMAVYSQLKARIHEQPLLENDVLFRDIEAFGRRCQDKKFYFKLRWKYKWHRICFPQKIPLGKPSGEWTNRNSPLVSVLLPNYNHASYLAERIECILNQTFQNFELIILDDCSTDNSQEVIERYKDHPQVSYVVLNKQNTGNTFMQWEKGISMARGEYIWLAESDDYADETFLGSAMAMFCLHPDCVMVRTGSYLVNERNRVLPVDLDMWKEDETMHYYNGYDYIRHNMLHFNFVYNASMVVFRKEVFLKIDKSYQQLRHTGDWQCWIEMLTHGPVCEYHRKLNYFRQHQNKVSSRAKNTGYGVLDQVRVMVYVLNNVRLSAFRRLLIRGECYHICLRQFRGGGDEKVREACFEALHSELQAKRFHYRFYKFVSLFSFLPFIPSLKNDKYK